jgi:hypothetical protein
MYSELDPAYPPRPLDTQWLSKLKVARQRFEAARAFREQVEADATAQRLPRETLSAAIARAEVSEFTAYEEYSRVLKVFAGLVLDGKIPNDAATR